MLFHESTGLWCDPLTGQVFGKRCKRAIGHVVGSGYLSVNLAPVGARTRTYVHRIIYEAVHGRIAPGMDINHINGCKTDNRIVNLEVATRSENIAHAYRTGLNPGRKRALTRQQSKEISETRGRVTGREWSKRLGVSEATISKARNANYGQA